MGITEKVIEKLIVDFPGLLNWADFSIERPDLLIIARQPKNTTNKRFDLLALDTDGSLVIIEIKRDAKDAEGRAEAMEFQAIRYAASSRKMTADEIVEIFAHQLRKLRQKSLQEGDPQSSEAGKDGFRDEAVRLICQHLDEDADGNSATSEDLSERLNPPDRQKIYLVASDYEPDVISACAWLQSHDINIACFRLRPFDIKGEKLLQRERLIPPPELDEFMLGMALEGGDRERRSRGSTKAPPDKPVSVVWLDKPEESVTVGDWKEVLCLATEKALALGMSLDDLPMKNSRRKDNLRAPRQVVEGILIETNASAELIRRWISEMLSDRGKDPGFMNIQTRAGITHELPDA